MSLNYLFTDPNTYIEKMSVSTFNSLSNSSNITGSLTLQFSGGLLTYNAPYTVSLNGNVATVFINLSSLGNVTADSSTSLMSSTNTPFTGQLLPLNTSSVTSIVISNNTASTRSFYQVNLYTNGSFAIFGVTNGFTASSVYSFIATQTGSIEGISFSYILAN